MKILAIKFNLLGDVVMMTPALRALRARFPQAELHALVAENAAPLLANIPWLDKVWALPRKRGEAQWRKILPIVTALRREKFDRSVDFAGNDRGALLSLMAGARKRIGVRADKGFFGRRWCYHQAIVPLRRNCYEALRDLHVLKTWGVPQIDAEHLEIAADSQLAKRAAELLPAGAVLCHISASQPKKEWPLTLWRELAAGVAAHGQRLYFVAGVNERERENLRALREMASAEFLPPLTELNLLLAVIKRAGVFVSGDTGPLHFAVALGVPTVSLFAASRANRWAPLTVNHVVIEGKKCKCSPHAHTCGARRPCMSTISPAHVLKKIRRTLTVNGEKA
ncbi:MAG: glycosyltransferase family 9 protein [Verrucomicrobiales bacterium]|jgi:ADP-heptose:LPS heptosyltransferase|nr:glycosyltransferase family 9 protein [Verrucomicrobiales bacterium]